MALRKENTMKQRSGPNHLITISQQTGERHKQNQTECEDVVYTREHAFFHCCGIADGQSRKRYCTVGAQNCLITAADFLENKGIESLSSYRFTDELQFELIRGIRECIRTLSEEYRVDADEFASTLLLFSFNPETGNYAAVHLGDGCILGVLPNQTLRMISTPDNGMTAQYTWLTTSEDALFHLRFLFGNVKRYKRIVLLSDGAVCLCRGQNIPPQAKALIAGARPSEIVSYLRAASPADDASCIIIDF